jgi:hypothetical protein
MRQGAVRWFCVAAGLLLLGLPLTGQIAIGKDKDKDADKTPQASAGNGKPHVGMVQDWTSRYLLNPGVRVDDVLANGNRDPRLVYNMMRHQAALKGPNAPAQPLLPKASQKSKIDWAVSLENGYVAPDQFPAKYTFAINTESCQADYIVFPLTVTTSTFTQANLVGINNLYTALTPTPCNGGAPWVAFAYNTQTHSGGQLYTSPEPSADGSKVAFVESTATGSYFHVLVLPEPIPTPGASPTHVGTVLNPVTPTSCSNPSVQSCMTSLAIPSSISVSSPWIDYASDTAYVGNDNGILYKITPVFRGGAPALVSNADWPVTVSTSGIPILSDPVVDTHYGAIFIGDLDGYLYSVSLSGPGHTVRAQMDIGQPGYSGAGLVDPPIVITDPANTAVDQVFAFTGCSSLSTAGGAVTQVPASFTNSTTTTSANTVALTVSKGGVSSCTGGSVHAGAFDNNFYVSGSGGTTPGHLLVCGFNSAPSDQSRPRVYMLPFVNHVISTSISGFVADNTLGDECSPLTEFYNGTADMLFLGAGNSYLHDPTPDGFVESSTIKKASLTVPSCTSPPTSTCVTAPPAIGGVSGIIIDNEVTDGGTNIYFTTLGPGSVNGGNCSVAGGTANPYCAVKLTQSALQ